MEIIVALDFSSENEIISIASQLDPEKCLVKLGLEAFVVGGPNLLEQVQNLGHRVFLDLKLDDIPETIYRTVKQFCSLDVWGFTVHTKTGSEGMSAASSATDEFDSMTYVFGVTALTSMNEDDLYEIGIDRAFSLPQYVQSMADLAWNSPCYLDGVVCSVREALPVRKIDRDILIISPGIRMERQKDDQKRVATIDEAIEKGVDYAVIGREITRAKDPIKTLEKFYEACE